MTHYIGLDVSQKLTAICIVDDTGRRLWRGQCTSDPEHIERVVRRHAEKDGRIGVETGPMTPWLVHELRSRGLEVTCLDARHARAALKMQINKTDPCGGTGANHAHGMVSVCACQIVRVPSGTGLTWRARPAGRYDNALVESYSGCTQNVRLVAGSDAWRAI